MSLLLTWNIVTPFSGVSFVEFEQVNFSVFLLDLALKLEFWTAYFDIKISFRTASDFRFSHFNDLRFNVFIRLTLFEKLSRIQCLKNLTIWEGNAEICYSVGIYMSKVNNKDTRMTPLVSFWCLYCYLLKYFTPCSSVSIVNFKYLNM